MANIEMAIIDIRIKTGYNATGARTTHQVQSTALVSFKIQSTNEAIMAIVPSDVFDLLISKLSIGLKFNYLLFARGIGVVGFGFSGVSYTTVTQQHIAVIGFTRFVRLVVT